MMQETTHQHRLSGGAEVTIHFYWEVVVADGASEQMVTVVGITLVGALIGGGREMYDVSNEAAIKMVGANFENLADEAKEAWETQHVEYQMQAACEMAA
jgi:hypothetical protein